MTIHQMIPGTVILSSCINSEDSLLSQLLHQFCDKTQANLSAAPFLFHVAEPFSSAENLAPKIELAIDGLLYGEHYALQKANLSLPIDLLTQADYLQLPLLTLEMHQHGIGIPEILNCWESFINLKNSPEWIAANAVKDGCPALKIGQYQAFSPYQMHTVCRVLSWAFAFADNAQSAACKAYTDARITAYGEMLNAAVFFTTAIAYAFTNPPKQAVTAALYGMPLDFINSINNRNQTTMITPDTTPTEHCALFFNILQNASSLDTCLQRFVQYHADICCFEAAAAIYNISTQSVPLFDDRIAGKLKFSKAVSKKDLAARYAALTLKAQNNGMAWK